MLNHLLVCSSITGQLLTFSNAIFLDRSGTEERLKWEFACQVKL